MEIRRRLARGGGVEAEGHVKWFIDWLYLLLGGQLVSGQLGMSSTAERFLLRVQYVERQNVDTQIVDNINFPTEP
jgi:hypothetical protein